MPLRRSGQPEAPQAPLHEISDTAYEIEMEDDIWDIDYEILDTGYEISDIGYEISDIGYEILDIGYEVWDAN